MSKPAGDTIRHHRIQSIDYKDRYGYAETGPSVNDRMRRCDRTLDECDHIIRKGKNYLWRHIGYVSTM